MKIKIIAAVSLDGIIGVENTIPWSYPEDMKFFKQMTTNSTVIMGRKTYESIGKPLSNRRNIVISKVFNAMNKIQNVEVMPSVKLAIEELKDDDIYLIGGASIYEAGMEFANEIYLTLIPKIINNHDHSIIKNYIRFPWINPLKFKIDNDLIQLTDELKVIKYVKS